MSDGTSSTHAEEQCIGDLLQSRAGQCPEAVAIVAPGRPPLTYAGLYAQARDTVKALNAMGVARTDRVAMVIPNGPEMAVAFLAVASGATAAPLNPAYTADEFGFYLADLRAGALLIQAGLDSPARAVAQTRRIPVIELSPTPDAAAGLFSLTTSGGTLPASDGGFSGPDDVALLLHTSGTTARPKIVPLTHANLCTSARNIRAAFELAPDDRCLNVMPLFHVHGLVGALLSSVAAGGSVACTLGFDPGAFFLWLRELRPTWTTAVPTMHRALLEYAAVHPAVVADHRLRFIRSCSAALPPQVMSELERVFGVPVVESYGMTEAAHQMTSNPLPPLQRKPGSVGVPTGPEVAILDDGNPAPVGRVGEIVVRGPTVMAGYEGNPADDDAAFCQGWFRTGDQGVIDADGYLFITGRTKEIINRGGQKVAPRDVEEAVLDHPAVAQAVAFAVPHATLGEDVAVAVVLREGTGASEKDIRHFAVSRLASYKAPSQVLILDQVPTGPTGKLQRTGLAQKLAAELRPQHVAPRNDVEQAVAAIWTQVLGITRVGVMDNFFALGGDSIRATQVVSRVEVAFDVALTLTSLFREPTVEGLASTIEGMVTQAKGPSTQPPRSSPGEHAAPEKASIPPRPDRSQAPLSFAQERLWFLDQMTPGSPAHNRPLALRLSGPLDRPALEQALAELLRRHEVLRATFSTEAGRPVQFIHPPRPARLRQVDLSHLPPEARDATAAQVAAQEAQEPIHLAQGPVLRSSLLRLDSDEHVLLIVVHHIAFDGWSARVLTEELTALYSAFSAGLPSPLAELPVQYADYAQWQRQRLAGDRLEEELSYWKAKLAACPPSSGLPTTFARPAVQTHRGARHTHQLPPSLQRELQALSRREGVTLFMTLLAAFQVLLCRYTGQEDVMVGSPIAGRTTVEAERLIGLFINTLVIRTDLSGNQSFKELLGRVRQTALEAYAHQDLPFERLVQALGPDRSLGSTPLFQVVFNLENLPRTTASIPGMSTEDFEFDTGVSQLDLSLEVTEGAEGLSCRFTYSTDLFDEQTIRRMADHYHTLLTGVVADPTQTISDLPLLTEGERQRAVAEWNNTQVDYPHELCIHQLVEARTREAPDAVAVVFEDCALTYDELTRRANRLAHHLQHLGVGPDVLVATCMERSLELVVAMLGTLKAGGGYVPLDPSLPTAWLSFMLQDAGAAALLTQERLLSHLPAHEAQVVSLDRDDGTLAAQDEADPTSVCAPANLAYVTYTSGSTGKPKGVLIPHRGAVNCLSFCLREYRLTATDTVLQLTSISFDASVREMALTLAAGARLVLVSDEQTADPVALLDAIDQHGVTCLLCAVVSRLRQLLEAASNMHRRFEGVRLILVTGEALPSDVVVRARAVFGPHAVVVNQYGPAETTMFASYHQVVEPDLLRPTVPIGRPIANVQMYVLDRWLNPLPVGVPGELHIGGAGVGRGYLNLPDLTKECFLSDPFQTESGARLYRTGDLARYLPDGSMEFIGRTDHQVKIRGYRVELGEVEAALSQHPEVRDAVVVAREDAPGDRRLVAYIVPFPEAHPPTDALRSYLKEHLPEYAIPAAFITLAALPLTPVGKVDHAALPAPAPDRPDLETRFRAAQDPLEMQLTKIWEAVLGVRPVGIDDSFFSLGGHSLLAVRLFDQIARLVGRTLPLTTLFHAPTVRELADILRRQDWTPPWASLAPIRPGGSRLPLFLVPPAASTSLHFAPLAQRLDPEQPLYGLDPLGLDGRSAPHQRIEQMAAHYLREVRLLQPAGPYLLGGACLGGQVAFEMAQQLTAAGEEVALLVILDSSPPSAGPSWTRWRRTGHYLRRIAHHLRHRQLARALARVIAARLRRLRNALTPSGAHVERTFLVHRQAQARYRARPYAGRVVLFQSKQYSRYGHEALWASLVSGGFEACVVPGSTHRTLLRDEAYLPTLAEQINRRLAALEANAPGLGT
jgi:amino acid adenylation domain-containing protein